MIEQTKTEVEQRYCIANGFKHDAVVSERQIYFLFIIIYNAVRIFFALHFIS